MARPPGPRLGRRANVTRKTSHPPLHHIPCNWEWEHDLMTEDEPVRVGPKPLSRRARFWLQVLTIIVGMYFIGCVAGAFGGQPWCD